jgi:hypothetical protein
MKLFLNDKGMVEDAVSQRKELIAFNNGYYANYM